MIHYYVTDYLMRTLDDVKNDLKRLCEQDNRNDDEVKLLCWKERSN